MESATLTIDGMTCAMCIKHVTEALKGLDGVEIKEVGIGTATVDYDPKKAGEDVLIQAVGEAGYTARVEGAGVRG